MKAGKHSKFFEDEYFWNNAREVKAASEKYGIALVQCHAPMPSYISGATEEGNQLLRDYMNNFKEAGYYGKARIATYSGTNAMYELGTSSDENDRQMYLEYCRFIVNSPLRK